MNKTVSLWLLPIAIFKWTMFSLTFKRKQWDTSTYSVSVQYVGRVWSPIYWLRALVIFFMIGPIVQLQIRNETNIVAAPVKDLIGHIKPSIPKPIRYLYFFTALYMA